MTATSVPDRIGRSDGIAMAALILAGVGIPLWLAAAAGAIGIPTNDDWVYTRAAGHLFETGSVDMSGHTTAFIGQLVLAQPFLWLSGGDPWAFMAFGLTMASIAIAATYLLARRFVGTGSAILVVLLAVAFPGFARVSASFMTDVPAYALAMACLLLGTRWLQGDGGRLTFIASLGTGLLAFSIREFAIAAPVAILIAAWARHPAYERIWLAASTGALVAGAVGVFALSASMAGRGVPSAAHFAGLIDLGPAFATLAAVLLSATVLYVGQRIGRLSARQVIVGACLGCLVMVDPNGPLLGNLWRVDGFGGDQTLKGVREAVFGASAWGLSRALTLLAAILTATVAVSWGQSQLSGIRSISTAKAFTLRMVRSREAPLVLFLLGYAGELVLYGFVGGLYDRYLYPLVPVAAILLMRRIPRPFAPSRSHVFAYGALTWLLVTAFVITANSFAYDTARFREGEAAVAMGYDARTVDAGYEWVGSHGSGVRTHRAPRRINWWDDIWASFRPCAFLSNSPVDLAGYRLVRVNPSAYRQYLFFGPAQPLYLYGALTDDCRATPQAVAAP